MGAHIHISVIHNPQKELSKYFFQPKKLLSFCNYVQNLMLTSDHTNSEEWRPFIDAGQLGLKTI